MHQVTQSFIVLTQSDLSDSSVEASAQFLHKSIDEVERGIPQMLNARKYATSRSNHDCSDVLLVSRFV